MQVYMLSYHESVDVVKFELSASREKQSFINLIRKKAHMVMPVDQVRFRALTARSGYRMSLKVMPSSLTYISCPSYS
jgi:hypothetical protein